MTAHTARPKFTERDIELSRCGSETDWDHLYSRVELTRPDAVVALSNEDLLKTLRRIVRGMEDDRLVNEKDELVNHRRKYQTVAFELNKRKAIAPAFRPRLKPIRPQVRALIDDIHACDLQYIDLHWLAVNGRQSSECGVSARTIFSGETGFDGEWAWEFVRNMWPMAKKAKALKLSPFEEWETAIIRPTEVRDQMNELMKSADKFRASLERDCRSKIKGLRTGDVADWPELFVARRITSIILGVDDSRLDANISPARVAEVFSKITGKDRDRRTIATRMNRMAPHYARLTSKGYV